jgi:hypothetical protein
LTAQFDAAAADAQLVDLMSGFRRSSSLGDASRARGARDSVSQHPNQPPNPSVYTGWGLCRRLASVNDLK